MPGELKSPPLGTFKWGGLLSACKVEVPPTSSTSLGGSRWPDPAVLYSQFQTLPTCLMPGSAGVLPGPPAGGRRVLPVRGPAPDRAGLHRASPHLREDPDGLLPQLRPQLPHHQVHGLISRHARKHAAYAMFYNVV